MSSLCQNRSCSKDYPDVHLPILSSNYEAATVTPISECLLVDLDLVLLLKDLEDWDLTQDVEFIHKQLALLFLSKEH